MKQLFLILSLFCASLSFSQASKEAVLGQISGTVIDKDQKEPVPYATVIINNSEGKLVTGDSTQEDGSFIIKNVPAGTYTFQVQFIGYKTYSKQIQIESGGNLVEMGTVYLEQNATALNDVNIVAERSTIEQKIDRKVINVGKDLTTAGASASDIMQNLPTLSVDQDGNISMRGNSNVRVLLDGKPTNIPVAQLLKQIPSTSIKSIELITNPSAKYNPEGMSGIINIILRKDSNLGFNGNVNAGANLGKNSRGNGSLDVNYRPGKVNFFTSLGTNFGKRSNRGVIDNYTNNTRTDLYILQDNRSYLYKVGMDFYMNDKNTFSVYTNQNRFSGKTSGSTDVIFLQNDFPNIYQDFRMDNNNTSSTYNFDYKHKFEKEGHNLEFEADYNHITDSENAFNTFSGNPDYQDYNDNVDGGIENTTLNLDYVNPLSEKSKLEMGAEARIRNSRNNYITTNTNFQDSRYKYNNSIYSFYTTFGQTLGKWAYQFGARLEKYDVEAILDGNQVYTDDYLTVYPSAFLSYQVSEMKTAQLSFSRRVDRPSLNQVNPVREFSSPRITVQGNPELNPQFTNSVEFNFTNNFNKGNFTAGVFYRDIQKEINQTIVEDSEDPSKLLLTYTNGSNNSAFGAEVSGSYKPVKWWNISPSLELYSRNIRGIIAAQDVEVNSTAFHARVNQSFTVNDKLTLQVFGFYRSPERELQFKSDEMYFVNAGAKYSILKDKGTLSLYFNDIFKTQKFAFHTQLPNQQYGRFNPETQNVYVGFSYRFGGGKNTALRRKNRDENEKNGGGIL